MFTGFASENAPAIQVRDFSNTFASSGARRYIYLEDDCAPIQYIKTGGSSTNILMYLPTAPVEGKVITIVNCKYGNFDTLISIRSSDYSGGGDSSELYNIGPGQTIRLVFSKEFLNIAGNAGAGNSGWLSLDMASTGSNQYWCVVVGGSNNIAATTNGGRAAVIGGSGNLATNASAIVAGGGNNTASATFSSVLGGQFNTANNSLSTAVGGNNNIANGERSSVIGGSYGNARNIAGNDVRAASNAPISSNNGIQQLATLLLGRQTTDATATRLTSNTSAAGTTNQVILPNNSAYTFQGTCIAAKTAAGDTSSWKFEGAIKRGANAASTVLVAAVTPTVIAQDAGASTWVLDITADTTNGGIAVTVTGQAATTIRWVCKIETTEVTF